MQNVAVAKPRVTGLVYGRSEVVYLLTTITAFGQAVSLDCDRRKGKGAGFTPAP